MDSRTSSLTQKDLSEACKRPLESDEKNRTDKYCGFLADEDALAAIKAPSDIARALDVPSLRNEPLNVQKAVVGRLIADIMPKIFRRRFKSNSPMTLQGKPCLRWICSGSGKPTQNRAQLTGTGDHASKSRRVGCNASIMFCDGEFKINAEHNPECLMLTNAEVAQASKSSFDTQLSPTLHSDKALEGFDTSTSFPKLLKSLQEDPERYDYRVYMEGDMVSAVHMHMRELAMEQDSLESIHDARLFMCDVTHGVCDSRAGQHRISSINIVTVSRKLEHAVVSIVEREDTATFISEASFLASIIPGLVDSDPIFIVDGDRGRINALRNVFPHCRIFLCLWHKEQNVQSHAGPAIRARDAKTGAKRDVKSIKAILKANKVEYSHLDTKDILQTKLEELHRSASAVVEVTSSANALPSRNQASVPPTVALGDSDEEQDEEEYEVSENAMGGTQQQVAESDPHSLPDRYCFYTA